jgi:hypothetical protein
MQVVVGNFYQIIDADMARMNLDTKGIQSQLRNEHIVLANPFYANAVGGIQLLVREEDAPLAKQVIDTLQ